MRTSSIAAYVYCVALLASFDAAADTKSWNFDVFLNDSLIGSHRFELSEQGEEREMNVAARFNVKVLFVSAYHYTHDAAERWHGNCLISLESRTDDDGKRLAVHALRDGDNLVVTSGSGRATGDGCVMSYAYWNPEILRQSRLLNSQTGEFDAVRIAALGEENITVHGAPVTARHYRISGAKQPIDLWYSANQEWLALASTVEGGRRLRYQLK